MRRSGYPKLVQKCAQLSSQIDVEFENATRAEDRAPANYVSQSGAHYHRALLPDKDLQFLLQSASAWFIDER